MSEEIETSAYASEFPTPTETETGYSLSPIDLVALIVVVPDAFPTTFNPEITAILVLEEVQTNCESTNWNVLLTTLVLLSEFFSSCENFTEPLTLGSATESPGNTPIVSGVAEI
ncbi:MAG: hypothetical protein ACOX69_08080 [Coriobacteriales bacterium]